MATIKKAQGGVKATKDSTEYFRKKYLDKVGDAIFTTRNDAKKAIDKNMEQSLKDMKRQKLKGKPGYDANGFPIKKKKMKNGGSLTGLNASNKRVGPVDPKGAFTKVQKKTLAGAKGKASLTKDKQLGATKMAKCGMKISKKK